MFVDLPPGVVSLCRSGANPFQPGEVLMHLREAAVSLQKPAASDRIGVMT